MAKQKSTKPQASGQSASIAPQPTRAGLDPAEIQSLKESIRGMVLNGVAAKYDRQFQAALESLKERSQIEVERISRDREETLIPRLKESVRSRVMQDIKKSSQVTLDEEVQWAIKTCIDEKLGDLVKAEIQNSLTEAQATRIEDLAKSTTTEIDDAVAKERHARVNSVLQLQQSFSSMKETHLTRIEDLAKSTKIEIDDAVTKERQARVDSVIQLRKSFTHMKGQEELQKSMIEAQSIRMEDLAKSTSFEVVDAVTKERNARMNSLSELQKLYSSVKGQAENYKSTMETRSTRIENVAKSTKVELVNAVNKERRARMNGVLELQRLNSNTKARIRALCDGQSSAKETITQSFAKLDEIVKAAMSALEVSTAQRMTTLGDEVLKSLNDSQEALAVQIDNLTTLWQEVARLRQDMEQRQDTSTTLMDHSFDPTIDLLSFEDDNALGDAGSDMQTPMKGVLASTNAQTETSFNDRKDSHNARIGTVTTPFKSSAQ